MGEEGRNPTTGGQGAVYKVTDPHSPWHGFSRNHRVWWGSDLGRAEWTEPGEQANHYGMPSWWGPRLQGMQPLKSHPKGTCWEGRQAGRQGMALRVWPQLPSSRHPPSRLPLWRAET